MRDALVCVMRLYGHETKREREHQQNKKKKKKNRRQIERWIIWIGRVVSRAVADVHDLLFLFGPE